MNYQLQTTNYKLVVDYYLRIPLYILFGVLPSLIWLAYYMSKDMHPEPKKMILKVFVYGVLITVPVFFIQVGLALLLDQAKIAGVFDGYPIIGDIIKWFIVIALTEEFIKYLGVRFFVVNSANLDEPFDIMFYMVVVALGFASLENILYLFSPINNLSFQVVVETTLTISFIRFIGATFLHTLCSAVIGYYMALSLEEKYGKFRLLATGIIIATLLHGLYDFSIITLPAPFNAIIPALVIIGLAGFMLYDFDKIKKIKGICKI